MRLVPPHRHAAVAWTAWLAACASPDASPPILRVASSLAPPVQHALEGRSVTLVTGATSTLVQHALHGAPTDLLLAAHPHWAQTLHAQHPEHPEPVPFVTHRLVWASAESPVPSPETAGCLVTGDPAHVPLGMWAQDALSTHEAAQRMRWIPMLNAAAAAHAVATGACSLGVLYASDAQRLGLHHRPLTDAKPLPTYALALTPRGAELLEALRAQPEPFAQRGLPW